MRMRYAQNWLWVAPLFIFTALFARPTVYFPTAELDIALDIAGVLLLAGGIWIRVCARGWKREAPGKGMVTDGPYGYVRHPLYVGSFLIGAGLCAVSGNWRMAIAFALLFWLSHLRAISQEERWLAEASPVEFAAYRARVGGLIPRWSSLRAGGRFVPRRLAVAVRKEADAVCLWPILGLLMELFEH
jgi:protein-S-isoprenylcysteine O-methyltransferase Ste14